jgi:hypothetical protein
MIRRSGHRFAEKIMRKHIFSVRSDAKPVTTFADRTHAALNLKFLNELAAIAAGTSNSPH